MLTFENMKILRNILRSHERKRFYSTNSNILTNTFKCQEHNEYCRKICLECNIDICPKCEHSFHNKHKIIKYDEINPSISEIESLQNKIKIYIDKYNNLKKEIYDWNKEIQNKLYDFEISLKHNEIINSFDFISNYSKNKICLNSILKFRKIYYNIMDENNPKNVDFINAINQFGNNDNMNLPPYYQFIEIKNLMQNLNYNSNNFMKKTEYIIDYLSKIPLMTNINIFNNYNFNYISNDKSNRSNSISNFDNSYKSKQFKLFNEQKLSESIYDKSTGYKNYNEKNSSVSNKNTDDKKVDNLRKIINKTKISEFNLNNNKSNNNLNKTYNYGEKKNYSLKDITKYLNKMGYVNINKEDINKMNSSQDLLNQSSCSIKSTKYVQHRSNLSTFNFNENYNTSNNNNNNNTIIGIKSSLNSMINNTIENTSSVKKEQIKPNLKKMSYIRRPVYINKNAQTKTYVHKKFNSNINNNISKVNDTQVNINKINISNINISNDKKEEKYKVQKKILIINNPDEDNNNKNATQKDENNNKKLLSDINQNNNNKDAKISLIKQKIIRSKQSNEDILITSNKENNGNKENNDNDYSSPIKPELFKNAIISDAKKNIINDYDNDNNNNEINNINTADKKILLNQILFSPSANIDNNTNKKLDYNDIDININNNINENNITFQTYKMNNSTSNINTPNIVKTNKNSSFFVDPEKELCLGLELGNSECKVGIVNQNTSEIQLVCFEENKYSLPTLVSFGQNKKEIKIGHQAEEEIICNPSQTISNIIKYFGKKFNEFSSNNKLYPFKVYYTNDEENKPYIKVNFGPQKDKVFYFENILSIFLEKMFEIIFNKVNLENSSNYNTQEKIKGDSEEQSVRNVINLNIALVITVPNYFSYYQRKLIENIIKTEIFPDINNSDMTKIYGKYKINLIGLRIQNASSIASVCLNSSYNCNDTFNLNINKQKDKNNNILILNLNGGSSNASITSLTSSPSDKINYQVKAINGLSKGKTDIIDNLMLKILQKLDEKIKNKILDSPLSLIKLRKICEKMRTNLIQNDSDVFNVGEILDDYDEKVVIKRDEYDNCSINFYNDIKLLINDVITQTKIKEEDINEIVFIGELCREKNFEKIIEQSFKQFCSIHEELIYSNYMDNEKDFYIVGGAAFHALNSINNNIYSFNDISPFNIGIEKYNGYMDLIVSKGDKIPVVNKKSIKISNESNELKIYEVEDNDSMKNRLIKVIKFEGNELNKDIINGYTELKIEYEFNEKFELNIKLFNGEKLVTVFI